MFLGILSIFCELRIKSDSTVQNKFVFNFYRMLCKGNNKQVWKCWQIKTLTKFLRGDTAHFFTVFLNFYFKGVMVFMKNVLNKDC